MVCHAPIGDVPEFASEPLVRTKNSPDTRRTNVVWAGPIWNVVVPKVTSAMTVLTSPTTEASVPAATPFMSVMPG